MAQPRKPDEITPNSMKKMKRALGLGCGSQRKKRWLELNPEGLSLKQFLKQKGTTLDDDLQQMALAWAANKAANPSHPPMGIGRTNGKKGKKGAAGGDAAKRAAA